MIYSELKWGDFRYLLEILGIERVDDRWLFREGDTFKDAEVFLSQAEERAALLIREQKEPNSNLDCGRLQRALDRFYFDRTEDTRFGLDYSTELHFRRRIVREETYPYLFHYLVSIPGDKGFGLDKENGNFGYHIHYVKVRCRRNRRTNTIFMFNPKEPKISKPILYWEPHHATAQVHVKPNLFGARRKAAIYDTCTPFLDKIPKQKFKMPSNNASRFHP